MVPLRAPNDDEGPDWEQTFTVERSPHDALDAAEVYLNGAGIVAGRLQGKLERRGDSIVIHHGRVATEVSANPIQGAPTRTKVAVHRTGRVPLEDTRGWLGFLALAATVLGWGLAAYNRSNPGFLSPMVTISLFFAAILAVIVVLYVVDRSMERRSRSIVLSLEDAIRGDPLLVLRREVDALEKQMAVANGILFYALALVLEFVVFVTLLGNGVSDAVTLEVMRWGFGIPIVPAVVFAGLYFLASNRLHQERFQLVERRYHDKRTLMAARVQSPPAS